eukprot:1092770-Prymnesium_polylepis.1
MLHAPLVPCKMHKRTKRAQIRIAQRDKFTDARVCNVWDSRYTGVPRALSEPLRSPLLCDSVG